MTSWKVTLPCTKAEAEASLDAQWPENGPNEPVITTEEVDAGSPEQWALIGYFEDQPTPADLAQFATLAPRATVAPLVELLDDEDWVTLSQQGLTPIAAGRFYVHPPHHPPREGTINFCIDAGQAFGTGQHATTLGCLLALDAEAAAGARYRNIVDLGTGTGLLAFAAQAVWPHAQVLATDNDPIAVDVAADNARLNAVPLGDTAGAVMLCVADGMDAPAIQARAPFDLIVANILAQPLIDMAPAIAAGLAPGGRLILSGLLGTQANAVAAAYGDAGVGGAVRADHGDWAVLCLRKGST